MTLHPIPLKFLLYEENFIFFFISAQFLRLSCNIFFAAPKLNSRTLKKLIKKQKIFTASDSSIPGTLHPPHADAREHRGLAEAKRGRRYQIR
jgi:hypothetical protein